METAVTAISLITILSISAILALWRDYKDGIIGHAALITMFASSFMMMLTWAEQGCYPVDRLSMLMFVGVAVFMVRHTINAVRFSGRNKGQKGGNP